MFLSAFKCNRSVFKMPNAQLLFYKSRDRNAIHSPNIIMIIQAKVYDRIFDIELSLDNRFEPFEGCAVREKMGLNTSWKNYKMLPDGHLTLHTSVYSLIKTLLWALYVVTRTVLATVCCGQAESETFSKKSPPLYYLCVAHLLAQAITRFHSK